MTEISRAAQVARLGGDVVSVKDFGAVGDGVTDDTAAIQAGLDHISSNGGKLKFPRGEFLVTTGLTYTRTSLNNPPLNMVGAGLKSTVFLNRVPNGIFLDVVADQAGTDFLKGSSLSDFAVRGDASIPNSVGLRFKGCWQNNITNVEVSGHTSEGINFSGDSAINPDYTASVLTRISLCLIELNKGGIFNEVNNNAPFLEIISTSIRNNTKFGIKGNSSYIRMIGGSLSFNGLFGQGTAEGGMIIDDQLGNPYRSKGILLDGVELDSNYPAQVILKTSEAPIIRGCSIQMADQYNAFDDGLFPEAQIVIGGSTANQKCFHASIHNNRFSINNVLSTNYNNHSIIRLEQGALGTELKSNVFNFSDSGAGLGSTYFYITELDKAGGIFDTFDEPCYYVKYDRPIANFPLTKIKAASFNVKYPKVFAGDDGRGLDFGEEIADDSVIVIPVPKGKLGTTAYNFALVTANGQQATSALVGLRAAGGTECYTLFAGTSVETTTGALTGTTGTDTKLVLSADAVGNFYVENRTGVLKNVHVSFLMNPPDIFGQL